LRFMSPLRNGGGIVRNRGQGGKKAMNAEKVLNLLSQKKNHRALYNGTGGPVVPQMGGKRAILKTKERGGGASRG